jgi:hypothetical protein
MNFRMTIGSVYWISYPSAGPTSYNTWNAAAKDQVSSCLSTITAYALAINDPDDVWDVIVAYETSDPASHPSAVATLPLDYTLTGGGAYVNYGTGNGNLLTASFPTTDYAWEARSKDHILSDPAPITAYAIGMKSKIGIGLSHYYVYTDGALAEHPTAVIYPGELLVR